MLSDLAHALQICCHDFVLRAILVALGLMYHFGWPVTLVYHCNSERPGFSWACWAVPLAEPRWYGLAGKVGCPMLVPTACPLGDGFACLLGLHALLFPDSAVLSKIGANTISMLDNTVVIYSVLLSTPHSPCHMNLVFFQSQR